MHTGLKFQHYKNILNMFVSRKFRKILEELSSWINVTNVFLLNSMGPCFKKCYWFRKKKLIILQLERFWSSSLVIQVELKTAKTFVNANSDSFYPTNIIPKMMASGTKTMCKMIHLVEGKWSSAMASIWDVKDTPWS